MGVNPCSAAYTSACGYLSLLEKWTDRPLEELRELIISPFWAQLDRLQQRVDNPPLLQAGDVDRVLPEAVSQCSARDKSLR